MVLTFVGVGKVYIYIYIYIYRERERERERGGEDRQTKTDILQTQFFIPSPHTHPLNSVDEFLVCKDDL